MTFLYLRSGFCNSLICPYFPNAGFRLFYQYGLSELKHATCTCNQYMMKLYLQDLFRNQIICYCQSMERRRREPKSRLCKYYRKIFVRQENSFDQKFTFANLAKVFRFTFAKWILPSPLAKCEGLCASLFKYVVCAYISKHAYIFSKN